MKTDTNSVLSKYIKLYIYICVLDASHITNVVLNVQYVMR